jgi:hypothetical protein
VRRLSAILSVLALTLAGCSAGKPIKHAGGPSSTSTTTAVARSSSETHPGSDNDGDGDGGADDIRWGEAPSPSARHAVVAVTEAYYKAAGTEDGGRACSLLYSLFEEEVAEIYGGPAAPSYLRGSTCGVVLHKLFAHEHAKLARESKDIRITGVRVKRLRGMALIHFGADPQERDIAVHLEHGVWKVSELLDVAPD